MSQFISYMDKAKGVTPYTAHATTDPYPKEGSCPALQAFGAGITVTVESKVALTAAANQMATNDIIVALPIPPMHVPVDCYIASDDLDTGTAVTLTVAELNQDFTDIVASTNFITASTVGQAGGIARASVADGLRLPPVDRIRWIGIKVAAGVTGLNANAVLSLTFSYRAANAD